MAASEAAVTAVMEALGCEPYDGVWNAFNAPVCERHSEDLWTDRGCPVAAAVADAAVDADRASIQAETLREAADEHYALADARPVPTGRIAESLRQTADWLRSRADRIEGKP
jgi:hypothetical protein